MLFHIKNHARKALAHQGFVRYFANTSWMFGEQLLRMVAGLFVGIWVARYLGPEQFGVFSYAIAFTSIFSTLAKLGLDGIVVRDLVREPEKRDIYLGTAFWLKICGAFIVLSLVVLAMQFTTNDHNVNLYIFIIASGSILQSFEVIDFYFQSRVLSQFVSICKIVQLVVSSLIKIYLVITQADLLSFVVVILIDQFILALSLYIAYKYQNAQALYKHFDLEIAKKMLSNSWPLILSGIAVIVYMRIDQIMIKEMLGNKEVGFYSAAVRLSELCYFIPILITNSLFPAIINAKKNDEGLYYKRIEKLFVLVTSLSITIALVTTILSQYLIRFLYGLEYLESIAVLAIHIWGAVFVFMGVATAAFLTVENQTKKSMYRAILGALSNIALNLLLIPRYGINGAAISTVLSQFTANFVYDFFDKAMRPLLIIKLKSLFPFYYIYIKNIK